MDSARSILQSIIITFVGLAAGPRISAVEPPPAVKVDPGDDADRRLLKERYNASRDWWLALQQAPRGAKLPAVLTLVEAHRFVLDAKVRLGADRNEQLRLRQRFVDELGEVEKVTKERIEGGLTEPHEYCLSQWYRLDAQWKLVQAEGTGPEASGVRRLLLERSNTADKSLQLMLTRLNSDLFQPEVVYQLAGAYRRAAESDADLAVERKEWVRVLAQHVADLKFLEQGTRRRAESGLSGRNDADRARFLRLDAEVWSTRKERDRPAADAVDFRRLLKQRLDAAQAWHASARSPQPLSEFSQDHLFESQRCLAESAAELPTGEERDRLLEYLRFSACRLEAMTGWFAAYGFVGPHEYRRARLYRIDSEWKLHPPRPAPGK